MMIIQEHAALFMRNHYRGIIGRTQKERARYCRIGREGEREREETEGEGIALVFIEDSYFWF